MLRIARGEDPRSFFSLQTPLLSLRAHQSRHGRAVPRPHAQALCLARVPHVPAVLADVVGLVGADHRLRVSWLASALIRLPEAWPWARQALPRAAARWSDALVARATLVKCALGMVEHRARRLRSASTPGSCSNTMVARPLWNSCDPRSVVPGSRGCRPAPRWCTSLAVVPAARGRHRQRSFGGAIGGDTRPAARQCAARKAHGRFADPRRSRLPRGRARADRTAARRISYTSSASHAAAACADRQRTLCVGVLGRDRRVSAFSFRSSCRALELNADSAHRRARGLVLVGGFALRWVMVNAGQASHVVQAAAG